MAKNEQDKGTVAEQEKEKVIGRELGSDFYDILGRQTVTGSSIGDFVISTFERPAGYTLGGAIAFGQSLGDVSNTLGLVSNILKEINQVNDPNSPVCKIKIPNNTVEKEPSDVSLNFSDYAGLCFQKSKLFQAAEGGFNIESVLNIVSEISKPADPAECINPYFDQFFNLIPVQFIISKLIRDLVKNALAGLSDQEVQEIINNVNPCGAELTKIYNNNLNIPEVSFPLFKIPAIPTIPNVNLYTVLNRLIIEAVCYAICLGLTPLTVWMAQNMNKFLTDFLNKESIGAGTYTEFLDKTLGKIDLNQQISDAILNQAIIQGKVGYKPDIIKNNNITTEEQKKILLENILLIRQYFKAIYDYKVSTQKSIYNPKEKKYETKDAFRELGTKEILFLMMGEYNCFTIQDLVEIGNRSEFKKLKLDNEQRIKTFFSFIGNDIDPIAVVTDLKKQACPPDPCEQIENEVVEEVQNRIGEICKVLNLKKSGLPPIPINEILKAIGLQDLFNQGIKEQFKQLKTEQLLFLGFPSIENYPTTSDIIPFLPQESGDLEDYALRKNSDIEDNLFKKYFLRGGPPLFWKYDNIDLNKNLVGSTLEDICGEEETFTETYVHIFNDIFKIDLKKIQESLVKDKEKYKASYEERVNIEFTKRPT